MTSPPSRPSDCEKCGGTGKIGYRTSGGDTVTMSDGTVIQEMSGYSTRACSCVRDLPAIEGHATWWETEIVWSKVWTDSIYPDSAVEMQVETEVPRDENGRRVHMRGNRYYPTMVDVELPSKLLMHPFQARDLALKLMAAAQVCEDIDEPCSDKCGHWYPCNCEEVARAT